MLRREIDTLYTLIHKLANDPEQARPLFAEQTREVFAHQWKNLPAGRYLLSDPWFKQRVDQILSEEELQLHRDWFKGRRVLDAGCGNGRWTYGFVRLGAEVTAVDINASAVSATREAVSDLGGHVRFIVTPLEELDVALEPTERFDLVFSWGVLHHCESFNDSLRQVAGRVADTGILYLYLYGTESLPWPDELELYKERLRYASMQSAAESEAFLLEKAHGDPNRVHNMHDLYSPLVNRRFSFEQVRERLETLGFVDIEPTLEHTEIFLRAFRPGAKEKHDAHILPRKSPPYWFQHHNA